MTVLGSNSGSWRPALPTAGRPPAGAQFLLAGLAWILLIAGMPATALAEVGNTTDFMPSAWRSAPEAAEGGSSRAARRAAPRPVTSQNATQSFDDGSRPQRRTRTATPVRPERTSVTGGSIAWRASSGCLAGNLRSVIASAASSFGTITVNSTCRSHSHNRAVGGAPKSYHLTGQAADIRVNGNWRGAVAFLRSSVNGFKHYGGGRFHIDNGPHRTF